MSPTSTAAASAAASVHADVVVAVFRSRDRAETAVERLRLADVPDDQIGLARLEGRRVVAAGSSVGSLAGVGFVAASLAGVGAVALAGALAPDAPGGAALVARREGLAVRATAEARPVDVRLESGEVLLVVQAAGRAAAVRAAVADLAPRLYPEAPTPPDL